jgi:glycosyltransferase involved in cell wall biosynthesis
MRKPQVLIDASPMLDISGHRGIGRFVQDLLHGLDAIRSDWDAALDIRVVCTISAMGRVEVMSDVAGAAERTLAVRGTQIDRMAWKRRLYLGKAARNAELLYLPEALGMPLVAHSPCVVTCHDLVPLRFPDHYLKRGARDFQARREKERRRYAKPSHLIAISEKTRSELVELLAMEPARITVVPHGIDLDRWTAAPQPNDDTILRRYGLGARPYAIYVGYGDMRKGIEAMFASLSGVDLDLVWAGKLSPERVDEHKAQARAAGIADRVRFLGFVPDEDLGALYRAALAHLFLSKLEGFGLSVAESMSCGCPVIVVRGSGSDDVAGNAGFIVGPDDPVAAATALSRLAGDPGERARRSALGIERVKHFDRARMAADYVRTWMKVLSRSP